MIDIPNERSSHTNPTPRGGGLVISALTLAVALIYLLMNRNTNLQAGLAYVIGGALIAWVGWLDDKRNLSTRQRFAVQTVSALIAIAGIGYWQRVTLPLVGQIELGIFGLPLTIIWIVGLVNAYNFMDGIDGIAGSTAVIAGVSWAVIGGFNDSFLTLLGIAVAGSSLGFLGHNWSPAKIFMGDVGSTLLGYSFAVIPLISTQREVTAVAGALLIWPFILDTTFTIILRLRRGENIFQPHRSHLYQRLVIAGYKHRFVTSIYIVFAMIGTVVATLWLSSPADSRIYAILIPILIFSGFVAFVRYQEMLVANRV
jgi:UDP-N-acetylmuramyl pentapeptide phosphotransferase/UDP-N-acetylglucosamine-1-phosphate transferase